MHQIPINHYVCDYCGKIYRFKNRCREHERFEHKCPNCEHEYYAYGTEWNCERDNQGKPCRFKKKKEVK